MKEEIVAAGLGLAGAGIQQAFGAANMKRQHNYSKQLLQFQWDNQVPSVVNSLKRAGLNPGLMYSNGGPSVGGSTGQTTAPQVGNPLLGVGDLMLDRRFKEEQIEAMKIENAYREERLQSENALAAMKVKTEEATQAFLAADTKYKEQQTAIGVQVEQLQKYLAEYQRDANPYLISKAHAEWIKIMEEAQKFKDESATIRESLVRLSWRLVRQEYESIARAFYYNSLGAAASKNAETQDAAQKLRKELQPRMIAVQEALQKYKEDMSSSEKFKNYMQATSALIDAFASVATAGYIKNLGKGNQLPPVKNGVNMPNGFPSDYEFMDF